MAQTPKQLANLRPPWKKGERGNPHYAGRAKGSRNKITQAYIDAIAAEFEAHGVSALERVRKKMPHVFLRLVAELLPKQVQVEHGFADMTDEQLRQRIAELDAAIAQELGAAPRASGPDVGTPPTDTRH
jgi:hypothetical protein